MKMKTSNKTARRLRRMTAAAFVWPAMITAGATSNAHSEPQRVAAAQSEERTTVRRATTARRTTARAITARQSDDHLTVIEDVPIVVPERATRSAAPRRMRSATGSLYALPFKGEDLNPGERYYRSKAIHSSSGTQKWGYDLSARKLRDGKWSSVKSSYDSSDPKNTDYYVYGKPVYAMGDGTIIRCWRNAPDNPRPFSSALGDDKDEPFEDRDWLHQAWRDKKMSGAGNHILVEEDDGDLVLYAHFKPGSLSSSLCPHNATLIPRPIRARKPTCRRRSKRKSKRSKDCCCRQ